MSSTTITEESTSAAAPEAEHLKGKRAFQEAEACEEDGQEDGRHQAKIGRALEQEGRGHRHDETRQNCNVG